MKTKLKAILSADKLVLSTALQKFDDVNAGSGDPAYTFVGRVTPRGAHPKIRHCNYE